MVVGAMAASVRRSLAGVPNHKPAVLQRAFSSATADEVVHAHGFFEVKPKGVTHSVLNQASLLDNVNLYSRNAALRDSVKTYIKDADDITHIEKVGQYAGSAYAAELASTANINKPQLVNYDRNGRRVDRVRYHPTYHALMRHGIENQTPSYGWRKNTPGSHTARGALCYLTYQAEPSTSCPLTMTYAAVPILAADPHLKEWYTKATTPVYDERDVPISDKEGVVLGMSMTEKQGGSDVRANTTFAQPLDKSISNSGLEYELTGHKWFTSAPMCDGFLTLAQTSNGITCFLVPRWLPNGSRNTGFRVQRLKDKLGDHANASSEIEYDRAWAQRVGPEGQGIKTIMDMVSHTRLDCALGSASLMHQSVLYAVHHGTQRRTFGARLADHPLMLNVYADLAVEAEASTVLAMHLAQAFDAAHHGNAQARAYSRLATAIAKFYVCKRAPGVVYEAMECFGGNGYDEAWVMPRLYRQVPLNSIWEGSGNVMCLDVLRAFAKEPHSAAAVLSEIQEARGMDARLDGLVDTVVGRLSKAGKTEDSIAGARAMVDTMALALQGSLLLRCGNPLVAAAFCAARLDNSSLTKSYGALSLPTAKLRDIVSRFYGQPV